MPHNKRFDRRAPNSVASLLGARSIAAFGGRR